MPLPIAPFIKKQQTWIDKRGLPKKVQMKLLCFGLSRTGTSSLRVALAELGLEAYHAYAPRCRLRHQVESFADVSMCIGSQYWRTPQVSLTKPPSLLEWELMKAQTAPYGCKHFKPSSKEKVRRSLR